MSTELITSGPARIENSTGTAGVRRKNSRAGEQLADIGVAYRSAMGRHYPPMSVVQVVALMEKDARVEIEATAVLPDAD